MVVQKKQRRTKFPGTKSWPKQGSALAPTAGCENKPPRKVNLSLSMRLATTNQGEGQLAYTESASSVPGVGDG